MVGEEQREQRKLDQILRRSLVVSPGLLVAAGIPPIDSKHCIGMYFLVHPLIVVAMIQFDIEMIKGQCFDK